MAVSSVLVGVVDQRQEARALDRHAELALVTGLRPGDARRDDLAVLVDEVLQDRDVHDPEAWRDKVLCSEPERDAFKRLLNMGLQDSFRLFDQAEKSYTWWDYRMMAFRLNRGLRIDHILISDALAKNCVACTIDKQPRKLERPSDHAPVTVEVAVKG